MNFEGRKRTEFNSYLRRTAALSSTLVCILRLHLSVFGGMSCCRGVWIYSPDLIDVVVILNGALSLSSFLSIHLRLRSEDTRLMLLCVMGFLLNLSRLERSYCLCMDLYGRIFRRCANCIMG